MIFDKLFECFNSFCFLLHLRQYLIIDVIFDFMMLHRLLRYNKTVSISFDLQVFPFHLKARFLFVIKHLIALHNFLFLMLYVQLTIFCKLKHPFITKALQIHLISMSVIKWHNQPVPYHLRLVEELSLDQCHPISYYLPVDFRDHYI